MIGPIFPLHILIIEVSRQNDKKMYGIQLASLSETDAAEFQVFRGSPMHYGYVAPPLTNCPIKIIFLLKLSSLNQHSITMVDITT